MPRLAPLALALSLIPTSLASAQAEADETSSLTWVLERARALDAQADYGPAADLYEVYAEACLDDSTAQAERGDPCADTGAALMRAFELRRALSQPEAATRDAQRFRAHFLYARPREALQVGYQVARMHIDGRRYLQALRALDAIDASFDAAPARQAIVSDGLRAVIAGAVDRPDAAARLWRRVERRAEADRAAIEADGPVPIEWVQDAIAEARLVRAQPFVDRYFATRPPHLRGVRSDRRWWQRVSAWLVRSRRRLALARHALERVYEVGSARHSVVAAARIGEMYGHQLDVHASLSLPDDESLWVVTTGGDDRPGYDEARTHFETCVAWAAHHAVASRWASRCEEGLNRLDPASYPMQAELHGEAGYHPTAAALPPGVRE